MQTLHSHYPVASLDMAEDREQRLLHELLLFEEPFEVKHHQIHPESWVVLS